MKVIREVLLLLFAGLILFTGTMIYQFVLNPVNEPTDFHPIMIFIIIIPLIGIILFGVALYKVDSKIDSTDDEKANERNNKIVLKLDELIKEIRQDRNERNSKSE